MSAELDITIERYRDFTFAVVVDTELDNPFGMGGYTCVMTVKALVTDTDAAALYHSVPTSGSLSFGQMSWLIPHSTTGSSGWAITSAVYDVAVQTPAGQRNTFLNGAVTITMPTTQTAFP